MTSPELLRAQASAALESAAQLLASDPGQAARVATRAAALAVEARRVSRRGDGARPAEAPNGDLDALLRLTDRLVIGRSRWIDWERIATGGVDAPANTGLERARSVDLRIAATRDLLRQLQEHQIIEQLMKLEIELADEFGALSVFSWVKLLAREETRQLLVSGWGVPVFKGFDGKELVADITARAKAIVGADLAPQILGVIVLDPRDPRAKAYMWPFQGRGAPMRAVNQPVDGMLIADSFQITNQNVPQPPGWSRPGDDPPKTGDALI